MSHNAWTFDSSARRSLVREPPSRISRWALSALRDLISDGAVFLWSIFAFTIFVTGLGLFTVDPLGEALGVMAIGLVLAPVALLLARGCANRARLPGHTHARPLCGHGTNRHPGSAKRGLRN